MAAIADPRHRLILDAVRGERHISQRTLGRRLGLPPSLVNRLIRELVHGDHLEVVSPGVRPFAYRLTAEGEAYLGRLSRERYADLVDGYREMRGLILDRLRAIRAEGIGRLVFYGAGEVMEVTLPLAVKLGFEVMAVVDDDPRKQGTVWAGLDVEPPTCLGRLAPDGVLITTLRHADEIRRNLAELVPASVRVFELGGGRSESEA